MAPIAKQDIQEKHDQLTAAGAPFELEEVVTPMGRYTAYKNAPRNLIDILQAGRAHGDKTLIVYEGERWSFDRFFQQADVVRSWLVESEGIQPGDRVAIAMRNYPEWLMSFTASVLTGAITVPLNSWGKAEELRRGIDDCEPKVLFCDEERYQLIADQLHQLQLTVVVVRSEVSDLPATVHHFDAIASRDVQHYPDIPEVDPDSTALVLYTSGSTGYPKGVILTHRIMGQCMMNMYFGGALCSQFSHPAMAEKSQYPMCSLITVPLFHGTGLWGSFFVPLQLGLKIVLMYKWDARKALQYVEDEGVTTFTSVPAIVRDLLLQPDFDQRDTRTLCRFSMGGSSTPPDLPPLLFEKLGYVSRATGWGMTETCAIGTAMADGLYDDYPGSAGLVSPIMELRMVDADGRVLPPGEAGEIECRGVATTPGYWKRPDATAEIYRGDWMKTGDVGRLNEGGFLYITGRVKEIVIRGGENIYPGEIEDVVYDHEAVTEAVVFGVPDDAMGEELALVYYCAQGQVESDALRQFLKARLGGFKVPRYIHRATTALPLNVSNKFDKRRVRDEFIATGLSSASALWQ